jgi:hypothetical protein
MSLVFEGMVGYYMIKLALLPRDELLITDRGCLRPSRSSTSFSLKTKLAGMNLRLIARDHAVRS